MSTMEALVSDGFYLTLNFFVQTMVGYVFWIMLAKLLLPPDMGTYSLILNLGAFAINVTSLGLFPTSIKFISHYAGRQEIGKVKAFIGWVSRTTIAIHALVCTAIFLSAPFIYRYTPLSVGQLRLLAVVIFSFSLYYLSGNCLYALRRMRQYFLSESAIIILKTLVAAAFVLLGFSYLGVVGALVASMVVGSLYRFRWLPSAKGGVEKGAVWHYAMVALVGATGCALMNQISLISLGMFGTLTAVGLFTVALTFSVPVRLVPSLIAQTLIPSASRQWAAGDLGTLNALLLRAFKYAYFISIPLVFLFLFFTANFILLFASSAYLEAVQPLQMIAVAYVFFGLIPIFNGILFYAGRPKLHLWISLSAGTLTTVASFLLVPFFGARGAAAAFLFSTFVIFVVSFVAAKRHLKFAFPSKDLLKVFLASLPAATALYLCRGLGGILGLAVGAVSSFAVYVVALLLLRFFDQTDIEALKTIGKKLPRGAELTTAPLLEFLQKFV